MGDVVELKPATIAKLELGPKDVVIVRLSGSFDRDRVEQIGQTVKDAIPDHKVLVIADNITLEVVKKNG